MDVDNQYNPIPLDLTGYTGMNIRMVKPDGTVVFCGAQPSDPTDLRNGTITCTTPSRDEVDPAFTLDQPGIWQYTGRINFPAGRQVNSTDKQVFYVV